MAKVIEGIPEYITREQYLEFFRAAGFDPYKVHEIRFSPDGIHAVVFYYNKDGHRILDNSPGAKGWIKHRVFIPVRDADSDTRTTRVKPVKGKP